MAGIVAAAASQTHPDSGEDVSASGFITGEQIALTASPSGTNYVWSHAIPAGSNALRSQLSGEDEARAYFTPDVPGVYAIAVVVDGTTYALRITVTQLAQSTALESLRLSPVGDTQVSAPAAGMALYYSSTQGALCVKDSAGDIFEVGLTAVP